MNKKVREIIFFVLIITFFASGQAASEDYQKGSDEKVVGKESVQKKDVGKWERWEKGELKAAPGVIVEMEEQFKVLLERWREKVTPDIYIVEEKKGDILINQKELKTGDKISIRKDQIAFKGICLLEIIDEKTESIRLEIKQNDYQKTRFYLADMNVPIRSIDVYYTPEPKEETRVVIELQQLTYELIVYEGSVKVVDISRPPIITHIPEPEPVVPEPYEG